MDALKAAYAEYKNIPKERMISNQKNKEKITALRAEISRLTYAHQEYWSTRKEQLKTALDANAMRVLNEGYSPNEVLTAIGSRNPTWIYNLKSRAPEFTEEEQESTHPALKESEWDYHDHVGSHGVLRSADKDYFKLYDLTEPETFCIVDTDLEFVTGSNAFYTKRSRAEFERLTEMLTALLDGTYQGKTRLSDNPFTA